MEKMRVKKFGKLFYTLYYYKQRLREINERKLQ